MMLSLEDERLIVRVIHSYAHLADSGDFDALAALYAPDVTTNTTLPDGTRHGYTGIEAQIDHARVSFAHSGGRNRHLVLNLVLEADGAQAIARYLFVSVDAGVSYGDPRVMATGQMCDTLRRIDGNWRIAERAFKLDQTLPS